MALCTQGEELPATSKAKLNETIPAPTEPRRKIKLPTEYNLRASSIINRLECETRRYIPRQPKPKSRPPPLSKYRRKTANSRERNRMADINLAFEELREAIPQYSATVEELDSSGRMTKITTLRLALNYIVALRDILGYENNQQDTSSCSDAASNTSQCISAAGEGSPRSDQEIDTLTAPNLVDALDSEGDSVASC